MPCYYLITRPELFSHWGHNIFYLLLKGPEVELLCGNPVTSIYNKTFGTLEPPKPWPICSQPSCKCANTKDLSIDLHKQILRFACNNTYKTFIDINGNAFIAPKLTNCGTYKPGHVTFDSRCTCPEMGTRTFHKYFYF